MSCSASPREPYPPCDTGPASNLPYLRRPRRRRRQVRECRFTVGEPPELKDGMISPHIKPNGGPDLSFAPTMRGRTGGPQARQPGGNGERVAEGFTP